jgi:cbb3-type cytochrome oxidase maturation protein
MARLQGHAVKIMSALEVLIPISIAMGCAALYAFFWSLRTRQYEDLKGAAERILMDDEYEERSKVRDIKGPPGVHHEASIQGGCHER